MLRRAVALVLVEAVLGIQGMQAQQVGVARRLGQDGRGGDRRHQRIALDHGLHGAAQLGRLVAVDHGQFRRHGQAGHGALHRQHGGAQDVQAVDFLHAGAGHEPGQRLGADLHRQRFALLGLEHLGVGQAVDRPVRVQDDGGRIDRSGQRSATGFVDAGNDGGQRRQRAEQVRLLHRPPPESPGRPAPAYRAASPGARR